MTVCHKEEITLYQVYDISKDDVGNITFLVYKNGKWVYDLADNYTVNFFTEENGDINRDYGGNIVLY